MPRTTGEAAALLGAELRGPGDLPLTRLDIMSKAGAGSLTFIRDPEFAAKWPACHATAAIVRADVEIPAHPDPRRALLAVERVDHALSSLLHRLSDAARPPAPPAGVHPSAVVDPTAKVDPAASVGPLCTVGPGAEIAAGAVLVARVSVGMNCRVGARTELHEGVVLRPYTTMGEDCLVHPNAVFGADGFGFDRDPVTKRPAKIFHLAGVRVGDRVEIGAGCTIDRGKFSDTIIEDDVKMDNLTHVGHATRIGRGSVVCGCCAIGGSVDIGAFATLGGGVHMPDNVTVEEGAIIAGGGFVAGNISAGEPWMGHPARPRSMWVRELRAVKTVARLRADLKDTIRAVKVLKERMDSGEEADRAAGRS